MLFNVAGICMNDLHIHRYRSEDICLCTQTQYFKSIASCIHAKFFVQNLRIIPTQITIFREGKVLDHWVWATRILYVMQLPVIRYLRTWRGEHENRHTTKEAFNSRHTAGSAVNFYFYLKLREFINSQT